MKDKPFSLNYDWNDFKHHKKLSPYQKHKIKNEYLFVVQDAIQKVIDEAIEDRSGRREELDSHIDPSDPFRLDIGGQG